VSGVQEAGVDELAVRGHACSEQERESRFTELSRLTLSRSLSRSSDHVDDLGEGISQPWTLSVRVCVWKRERV